MLTKVNRLNSLAFKFGLLGALGLLLGILGASLGYQGYEGEAFNFLNHTLSELGNYGHSRWAVILNGGIFFGSLCLVLSCLFLLQLQLSKWAYPFIISLALGYGALAITGLFPLNVYHLHVFGLKWFFYLSSLSCLCFVCYMAIVPIPHCSRWAIVPALMAFVSLTAFLFIPHLELGIIEADRPFYQEMVLKLPRPKIWWPALLEWLSLGFILIWTAALCCSKSR